MRNARLAPGSAAIDKGTPLDLCADFVGVERPQGAAPEMGAFEFR
jgi:hypothetical protein